jgi:hypothetical protein
MVSRGQFWYNTAISGVQRDLAVYPVCEQAVLRIVNRDRSFVAARLNAQNCLLHFSHPSAKISG